MVGVCAGGARPRGGQWRVCGEAAFTPRGFLAQDAFLITPALRIALNPTAFGDYNGAMGERTPEWKINSGQGVGTPLSLSRGRVGGKGEKDTGFRRPLLPRLALHVVLAALPRMFSKPPTLSPGHILTRLSRPRSHDLSSEEHFHVPTDARLSVPSSASS